MEKLDAFIRRMDKINIEIELSLNFPWIYIDKINGKWVSEKLYGNHGFTIAFMPIKKNQELKFENISELFKLIRKYLNEG